MCNFIGKLNEQILCKLSKSEVLRLYSIVHVAMETMKTLNFTCQSKSFIGIFFTCQVSACKLQPFSSHDLANDIYSQTVKTVFSHIKGRSFQSFAIYALVCLQNPTAQESMLSINISYKFSNHNLKMKTSQIYPAEPPVSDHPKREHKSNPLSPSPNYS